MIQKKRLITDLIVFIVFLLIVYQILTIIFRVDVMLTIGEHMSVIAVYVAAIFTSECIKSLRLALIYRSVIGYPGDLKSLYLKSLAARFTSNVVSTITPSASGGEFIRGIIVSGLDKSLIPVAVGVGLADGLYDLFANVLLAAALIPCVKPVATGAVIFLLGAGSALAWLTALLIIDKRLKHPLLMKIPLLRHPVLVKSGEAVLQSFNKSIVTRSFIVTLLSWVAIIVGYYIVVVATCAYTLGYLDTAAAIVYATILGMVPTPAGLVTMDTWLASYNCPQAAVIWRTSGLVAVAIMGLLSIPHLIEVIREYSGLARHYYGRHKTNSEQQ